jgi:AcrR family transcriptional regulator
VAEKTETKATGSGQRLPSAARRESILRAAGPLFARSGYAGTRLDDVAAAAGVTKPILYRHFGSKKGLYMALLAKHEDDLPSFFERVAGIADDLPPAALVRAILEHWLDYARANRHTWVMLFRDGGGGEDVRRLRLEVSARAQQLLGEFVKARGGRIPPEQVEPTAALLTSGLAGMVLWWADHPEAPKERLVEVALRVAAPLLEDG